MCHARRIISILNDAELQRVQSVIRTQYTLTRLFQNHFTFHFECCTLFINAVSIANILKCRELTNSKQKTKAKKTKRKNE